MKINILNYHSQFTTGYEDFYPVFKNLLALRKNGIRIKFYQDYKISKNIFNCDLIIIHVRCTFRQNDVKYKFFNNLRNKGIKVILFDGFDSSGLQNFGDYYLYDKVWKKQVFKDRLKYLELKYDSAVRPWISNEPPILYNDYVV